MFVCVNLHHSEKLYYMYTLNRSNCMHTVRQMRTNLVCNGTKKVYKNRNGNPVRPPHTPNSTVPMPRLTPGGEGQRRRRRRSHTATSCCQSQYHKHRPPAGKPNREVRRPARTTTTTTTNSGRQRIAGVDDVVVVGGRGSKLN